MKLYVVKRGARWIEFPSPEAQNGWSAWSRSLSSACQFTSVRVARSVAKRTGGTVYELVTKAVPVDGTPLAHAKSGR